MANVREWYPFLKKWEGFTKKPINVQHDKGGLTQWGITLGTWQTLAPRYFGIPGTPDTLAKLDERQWEIIAKKGYWDHVRGDAIHSQGVAMIIADIAWGSGLGRAGQLTQRALNAIGIPVTVDGAFGPKTLAAVNQADPATLYGAIHAQRNAFINKVIANDPTQEKFRKGWFNRMNDLYTLVKKKNYLKSLDSVS